MAASMPLPPDPDHAGHEPVLLAEVLGYLAVEPPAEPEPEPEIRIIDCTLGGGGHTAALLAQSAPFGKVLALDTDPAALRRVQASLAQAIANQRLQLVAGNFAQLGQIAAEHHFTAVDAILMDLGVSSFQLETAARGFSFLADGPLDMRFNPLPGGGADESAADIVNTWPETELAELIFRYGEERQSRRIARYLVQHRPFTTTGELAAAIERAVGGRRGQRLHPATQTFQALRIVVNHELEALEQALPQALALLKPGGRLAVISFHSLEDRIVKRWMQQEAATSVPDPASFSGHRQRTPTIELLTRKPVTATSAELQRNPRSRSAKLRVAKRIGLLAPCHD